MFIKRPHPGETEEDLLAMQEEFLAKKQPTNNRDLGFANETELNGDPLKDTIVSGGKPSGFKSTKPKDMNESRKQKEQLEEVDVEVVEPVPVIAEIEEKLACGEFVPFIASMSENGSIGGFPASFVVVEKSDNPYDKSKVATKGKSLFAQRMEQKAKKREMVTEAKPGVDDVAAKYITIPGPSTSSVNSAGTVHVQGQIMDEPMTPVTLAHDFSWRDSHGDDGDVEMGNAESVSQSLTAIDEENKKKLGEMTQDEIQEARNEIVAKIDPKMIEFLRRRKKVFIGVPCGDPENKSSAPTAPQFSTPSQSKMDTSPGCGEGDAASASLPADLINWKGLANFEEDKLAWLRPVKLQQEQKVETVRFDFEGNISFASNPDDYQHSGLHHHGEQPELPGYTLEELLPLARSAVQSQRILALRMLAKIVGKAKVGLFDSAISPNLLEKLIITDTALLIRTAIDENISSVCESGFNLLAAFLHHPYDEGSLDRYQFCSVGLWLEEMMPEQKKDETELTKSDNDDRTQSDSDACKLDFVKGLLRMGMLYRVRYVLEILRPLPANLIACVFHCLVRTARHSVESCSQILDCPRLLDVVMNQFVPSVWTSVSNDSSNYPKTDVPYWGAVKLLRIMISSSSKIAAKLATDDRLEKAILRYISCEPHDLMIPSEHACQLIVEAYRLWAVMVCYGHWHYTVWDMYHILMRHMQITCSPEALTAISQVNRKFTLDRACCAVVLIDKHVLSIGLARKEPLVKGFCSGFYELMRQMIRFHVNMLRDDSLSVKESLIDLIGACLSCCASLIQQALDVPISSVYDLAHSCTDVATEELETFCTKFSHLSNKSFVPSESNLTCLPCLPSMSRNCEKLHPFITPGCPMALLDGYFRCVNVLRSKEMFVVVDKIVGSSVIRSFLQNFVSRPFFVSVSNVFERLEAALIVKLLWCTCDQSEICYAATLKAVSLVDLAHSATVLHLINKLIDRQTVAKFVSMDYPTDSQHVALNWDVLAIQTGEFSHEACMSHAMSHLGDICASFVQSAETVVGSVFVSSECGHIDGSSVVFCDEIKLNGLMLPKSQFVRAAQTFWIFQPIASVKESTDLIQLQGESVKGITEEILSRIRDCLAWVYLLVNMDGVEFSDWVSMTELYRRVCDVFYIGPDVYKDSMICVYLWRILRILDSKLKARKMKGAYDPQHYESLVNLFESSSYGDLLFSHYVLLATLTGFPNAIRNREILWSDEKTVLRSLFAPERQILFPIGEFVSSKGDVALSEKMIILYIRALALNVKRGSFVEDIAASNIKAAQLELEPAESARGKLWNQLCSSKGKFPSLF